MSSDCEKPKRGRPRLGEVRIKPAVKMCVRCGEHPAIGVGKHKPRFCRECDSDVMDMEMAVLGRMNNQAHGNGPLKCRGCNRSHQALSTPSRLCVSCVKERFPDPPGPPPTNEEIDREEMEMLTWMSLSKILRRGQQ